MQRKFLCAVVLAAVLVSFSAPAAAAPHLASICFDVPAIVDCVEHPEFEAFWSSNGALPVFGYPVAPEHAEYNQDLGRSFTSQWFERARFEAHPENQPPYRVLLGRLGAEMLALRGRGFESPPAGAQPGGRCRTFDVGGRPQAVCDPFLRYWETHGLELDGIRGATSYQESLALFGLPLTYPQTETNPNGDTVRTQWFERARFEDHGSRGVLLGLLGRETLVTPIPGKPVHPIVDGDTGFLMGGVRAGAWVGPSQAAAHLRGGETYRLYALAGGAGQSSGSVPARETRGPCAWVTSIALSPPPASGALGVGGDWNARPRGSVDLGTQSEVYRTAIADILRANGIARPDVRLTGVLRIDLEGDGVDEVLISATRLLEGRGSPQVTAGDYSLVALRKVVDGQVRTIMLAADYYREDSTFAAPDEYIIANLLDLNGDGRVEIVVDSSYYEGLGTTVYEIIGDRAEAVLQESCGV